MTGVTITLDPVTVRQAIIVVGKESNRLTDLYRHDADPDVLAARDRMDRLAVDLVLALERAGRA